MCLTVLLVGGVLAGTAAAVGGAHAVGDVERVVPGGYDVTGDSETATTGPTPIVSCTEITDSGSYVLEANLSPTTQDQLALDPEEYQRNGCVVVNASSVSIDGQGYSINATGVTENGERHSGIHVENLSPSASEDPESEISASISNVSATGGWYYGISVHNASISVRNNTITGEHDDAERGIQLDYSPGATVVGNTIDEQAYGVRLGEFSTEAAVRDNSISNASWAGIGVEGDDADLEDNLIRFSSPGVLLDGANGTRIDGNTLDGGTGIETYDNSDDPVITNNTIVADGTGAAISLGEGSAGVTEGGSANAVVRNNSIDGTTSGIELMRQSVSATIVDNAIENVTNYGINVVGDSTGAFVERNLVRRSGDGIRLTSDDATVRHNEFVDSIEHQPGGNGYAVRIGGSSGSSGSIIAQNNLSGGSAGGLNVNAPAANTVFANNSIHNTTAGVHVEDAQEPIGITIRDNAITYNTVGVELDTGYGAEPDVNPRFVGNTIAHNDERGISDYISDGARYEDNLVANNGEEGLYLRSGVSNATVRANTFRNNGEESYGGGAGLVIGDDGGIAVTNATVADNVVTNNSETGIHVLSSDGVALENNSVTEHTVSLRLEGATNASLHENTLGTGLDITGASVSHYALDASGNALADGSPIAYLDGTGDLTVPQGAGQVVAAVPNGSVVEVGTLASGSVPFGLLVPAGEGVTVEAGTITGDATDGIRLTRPENATVRNVTVDATRRGVVVTNAPGAVLDNVTVTDVDGPDSFNDGLGISAREAAGFTVTDTRISGATTTAIELQDATGAVIEHTTVETAADGIDVQRADQIAIANTDVSDTAGTGIDLSDSEAATVTDNVVTNAAPSDETDAGIEITGSENVSVDGNDVSGSHTGIDVSDSTGASVTSNALSTNDVSLTASAVSLVADNTITDSGETGVQVTYSDGTTIRENTIRRNGVDTADGAGVFLDDVDGVTVVANDFEENEVGVYGDFASGSSIRDNAFTDNAEYGVHLEYDYGVEIENNTFTGHTGSYGTPGGIRAEVSADARIAENAFSGNDDGVELAGAGTSGDLVGVSVTVERNEFTSNGNGVTIYDEADQLTILENSFESQSDYGVEYGVSSPQHYPDARENWWGNETGPSSWSDGVSDPETNVTADGDGDRVTAGVRFDPWLETYPPVEEPTEITTLAGLQTMADDPTGDYVLGSDIDASGTDTWNNGAGFAPVGDSSTPFTGTFDGQGHTISGLYVDRGDAASAGLFGVVSEATIVDVELANADVNATGDFGGGVGALVGGDQYGSTISGVTASGTVSGVTNVGGIAGSTGTASTLEDARSSVSVTADPDSGTSAGGLVGSFDGELLDSSASGEVSGAGDVGGLVGTLDGEIVGSSASGTVTGDSPVGGLVGVAYDDGTISESRASGDVEGENTLGGLLGVNRGSVVDSYATGTVTMTSAYDLAAGGLVGAVQSDGTVNRSYATGDVSGDDDIGGLVGRIGDSGAIDRSYATGAVSGNGGLGGLVGAITSADGTLTNAYWDTASTNMTGAVGDESGTVENVTGLTTAEMQGTVAASNMPALDFESTWTTRSNDYPTLVATKPAGTVTGVVTDADTGAPIESASIALSTASQPEVATAETGTDGAYAVAVPAGTYVLSAESAGYETHVSGEFTVGSNETITRNVSLVPDPALSIATVDANGSVYAGDSVVVEATIENPDPVAGTAAVSLNASDGTVLDSTSVDVASSSQETVLLSWTTTESDVGDHDLTVALGAETQTVTVSVEERIADLFGGVFDANTTDPIAGATVSVADPETGVEAASTTTNESGMFSVGVEPGTYDVTADADGYEPSTDSGVEVSLPDTELGIGLTETPPQPATFAVSIDDAPTSVMATETVPVNATVENVGDETGSQDVRLRDAGGTTLDGESVQLAPGESTTVALSWETDTDDVGTHDLAVESEDETATVSVEVTEPEGFVVEAAETETEATAGDTVDVPVDVTNVGIEPDGIYLALFDGDGSEAYSQAIVTDIQPGETERVTIPWGTLQSETGTHELEIGDLNGDRSLATTNVTLVAPDLTVDRYPSEPEVGQPMMLQVWNAQDPVWDFDDGTTSTGVKVTHTFDDPGEYDVTVTDEATGDATETFTVDVSPSSLTIESITREDGATPLVGYGWNETFEVDADGDRPIETTTISLAGETVTREGAYPHGTFDLGELEEDAVLHVTVTDAVGRTETATVAVPVTEIPDWMRPLLEDGDVTVDHHNGQIVAVDDAGFDLVDGFDVDDLPLGENSVTFDTDSRFGVRYDARNVGADVFGSGAIEAALFELGFDADVAVTGVVDSEMTYQSATASGHLAVTGIPGPQYAVDAPAVGEVGVVTTINPELAFEGHFDEEYAFENGTFQPAVGVTANATVAVSECGVLVTATGEIVAVFDVGTGDPNLGGEASIEGGGGVYCGSWEWIYTAGPFTQEIGDGPRLPSQTLSADASAVTFQPRDAHGHNPSVAIPTVDETGGEHVAFDGTAAASTVTTPEHVDRLTNTTTEATQPAITRIGEEYRVVWSDRDANKTAGEGRDLLTRTYDPSSGDWSAVETITDDATPDESPVLASNGQETIAVWATTNETIDVESVSGPGDVLPRYEIAYAIHDGTDWSDPTVLTNTSDRQFGPRVAPVDGGWAIAWGADESLDGTNASVGYAVVDAGSTVVDPTWVDDATHAALGPDGDAASIAYASVAGDRIDEVVTGKLDAAGLAERERFDAGNVTDLTTAGDRTVWVEGTAARPTLLEATLDGSGGSTAVSELTLHEDVASVSELSLETNGTDALLAYRTRTSGAAGHDLAYRLDRGDGWIRDHVYADLPGENLTPWYADVTLGADGESFTSTFAARELPTENVTDTVDDVFVAEHAFRPTYALDASAESGAVGDSTTVAYEVANVGDVAGDGATVTIEANGSVVETHDLGPIAAGENATRTLDATVPADGTFTVSVDSGGSASAGSTALATGDEVVGAAPSTTAIAATPALSIENVTTAPAAGGSDPTNVSVSATIRNDGAAASGVPIGFSDGVSSLADTTVDVGANGTALATVTVDASARNATVADRVTIDPDGTLGVDAVDHRERLTWFVQPDLGIGDVSYVTAGDGVTAEVGLSNAGLAPANATVTVREAGGPVLGSATDEIGANATRTVFETVGVDLGDVSDGTELVIDVDTVVPDADATTTATTDVVGPVLATDRPRFAVTILGAPENVSEGDDVDVLVGIENRGTGADTQTVAIELDGSSATTRQVALDPGTVARETLTVTPSGDAVPEMTILARSDTAVDSTRIDVEAADDPAPGLPPAPAPTPDPASLSVAALDAPDRVSADESFTATVTVTNDGGEAGETDVTVALDGEPIDEIPVSADAGASTTVDVTVPVADLEPGTVELSATADGPGTSAEITVEGSEDGETGDGTDAAGGGESGTAGETTGGDGADGVPGFGAVAALVGVLLATALAVRRC
ncbi:right-handed parallel beta-helix repeat-containing protein [Halovivax cerinus]|uniref:Right-handed parallel beta-helix repeat-containing protein n=1 Tax=Halovivax cerinus TaxID=1487865 RepID=A0ABD5NQR0_9EURY|nr:right-handed parallel beta-helix repeat-containing protein [Halovivax cerinus]